MFHFFQSIDFSKNHAWKQNLSYSIVQMGCTNYHWVSSEDFEFGFGLDKNPTAWMPIWTLQMSWICNFFGSNLSMNIKSWTQKQAEKFIWTFQNITKCYGWYWLSLGKRNNCLVAEGKDWESGASGTSSDLRLHQFYPGVTTNDFNRATPDLPW